MIERPMRVLFLCTHNSSRSVLSEAILAKLGEGLFEAYSAGSMPSGTVNPLALRTLEANGHDVSALVSKSWDVFAAPGAPPLDFIFTLCDAAAAETCPFWPGHPATDHWGMPDPSCVPGGETDQLAAFGEAYRRLTRGLGLFVTATRGCQTVEEVGVQIRLVSADIRAALSAPYSTGA